MEHRMPGMDAPDASLVLGRETELARLERLLDDAPAGAALAVDGPRGSGVSTLLDAAAARAAARGMAVLRTFGVEAESGYRYAGLHQLLRPLRRQPLPDPLRVAFGIDEGPEPHPADVALAAL